MQSANTHTRTNRTERLHRAKNEHQNIYNPRLLGLLSVCTDIFSTASVQYCAFCRTFGQCCDGADEVGPRGASANGTVPVQAEEAHGEFDVLINWI